MSLDFIPQMYFENLASWFMSSGFKIAILLAGVFFLKKIGRVFIERTVRKAVVPAQFLSKEAEKKREDTLISVFTGTLNIAVIIVAVLMILQELGVEIGPLIAAAGIAGIAVGFGGQYLIRDVISGMFIILENQYRVGDVVCFDDTCGLVEGISLRMTTLRDLDGTVHHVPHGEIKKVSNLSKYYSRVNLNVGIN